MTIKVTSPVEGYSGTATYGDGSTLSFADGVAHTARLSDGVRAYLERRGCTIEDSDAPQTTPVELPDGEPDESWSHAQLDAYAELSGVKVAKSASKGDKLAALAGDLLGDDEKES